MPTPDWPEDFLIAVQIYRRTTALSGCDMNGYPQLTKLEFVLDSEEYEVEERARFIGYIEAIHHTTIKYLSERRG